MQAEQFTAETSQADGKVSCPEPLKVLLTVMADALRWLPGLHAGTPCWQIATGGADSVPSADTTERCT